jgi:hypothetical protein
MNMEQLVEWEGEAEVLEENLSQCHLVHHKSNMTSPRIEAGGQPPELWHGLVRIRKMQNA